MSQLLLKPAPPARHLLRAKDLIDARYRKPLDVRALARAAHLSPAHFSREFRRAFGETPHEMLKNLANVQVWVHDQDEALAFYTGKLGMELRDDVTVPELGNFRWLTVGVPGQSNVALALMAVPGPPVFDEETRQQILALMSKGAASGLFFTTEDIQATYEELNSRGVEFQQEPTEQPYGVDAGFRDPSGNQMRMMEQQS